MYIDISWTPFMPSDTGIHTDICLLMSRQSSFKSKPITACCDFYVNPTRPY